MKRFFNIAGWIIGIVSFLFIRGVLVNSIESLGIITYIDFGEEVCVTVGSGPTSYEDCNEGGGTDIAFYFGIFSAVLAVGLGNIIHERSFPPFSDSHKGKITYLTWLVCSLLICMTCLFVLLVVGPKIGVWINFVFAAVIAYYGYQYIDNTVND